MLETPLDPLSIRVLGCLMEKQLATPEYYPLTLHSLLAACNQTTSRDPVMKVDEEAVTLALEDLRERKLAWFVSGTRAQKFEQRLSEAQGLSVQEAAVLAELLLRGPQTPGELRSRCTRMYAFQDFSEVEAALSVMAEAETPLVLALPRQPGMKELRYAQTLGRPVEVTGTAAAPVEAAPGRMAKLEHDITALREELTSLRAEFEAFKAQF